MTASRRLPTSWRAGLRRWRGWLEPLSKPTVRAHHGECGSAARRAARADCRHDLHRCTGQPRPHATSCIAFLAENGFSRTGTVVDPGDFAVRGGIIDIYPPGADAPVRLDFFGDTLESIRSFDPESQRTTATLKSFSLNPANEVLLTRRLDRPVPPRLCRGLRRPRHQRPALRERDQRPALPGHGALAAASSTTGWRRCSITCPSPWSRSTTRPTKPPRRGRSRSTEFYQARREALDKKESFGAAPYKPLRPELALSDSRAHGRRCSPTIARWRFRPSRARTHLPCLWAAGAAAASRPSATQQDGSVYEAVRTHTDDPAAGRQARGHCQLDRRIARAPADDPQGP